MSNLPRSQPVGTYQRFFQTKRYRLSTSGDTLPMYTSELGIDEATKQVLTLGDKERRSGLYVLGRPGMGKSTLLVNLALQDIAHGHGVFFLDPHADAISDIMKRLPRSRKQDVLFFYVRDKTYSFGINLVACEDVTSLDAREDTFVKAYEVFHSLWQREWGPTLELIVPYLLRAFIENSTHGYTLADAPLFLNDASFRRQLVRNIRYNPQVAAFWRDEFSLQRSGEQEREVQAALNRIRQLLADPYVLHVIGQQKTTLDFSQVMKERKIVLVSFPANLPDDTRRFLGTILVRELLWAARERKTDRSQFCVFVDEFQNFATPDFASIIRETRKYGIAPTLAQQIALGPEHRGVNEAIDAMANKVVFMPTVTNAEGIAKEFAKRPEPAWVQELEPASVEVLEEESEEQKIDEWEDGVEPIMTVSQSPLAQLAQGHASPRTNNLISQFVKPLDYALALAQPDTNDASAGLNKATPESIYRNPRKTVDKVEYIATREQLLRGKQLTDRLLVDLMQERLTYDSAACIDRLVAIAQELRGFIGYSSGAEWSEKWSSSIESYWAGRYKQQRIHTYGAGRWIELELSDEVRYRLEALTAAVVEKALSSQVSRDDGESERALTEAAGEFRDAIFYMEKFQPAFEEANSRGLLMPPKELDSDEEGREWLASYNQAFRKAAVRARTETQALVEFLAHVYALCVELSAPENRVLVASDQYQPRKHRQIHYTPHSRLVLTHPRRELTHPQRSVADMVAEMELDLLSLAPYTAAYKLLPADGGTPMKGVLATFDLPVAHPYYIAHGLRRDIIAATHQNYSLPRDQIEREIQQRQGEDVGDMPSGAQPPPVPEDREKRTTRHRSIQIEE